MDAMKAADAKAADADAMEAVDTIKAADAAPAGAAALGEGALLIHPTSTVYGIGGRADAATDREVARLKGRSAKRPFLLLGANAEVLRTGRPGTRWDARAERLAAAFWPGPLTLVLEDGTEHGVAFRIEAHPATRALLVAWGGLMSSTSLNRHGAVPAANPDAVRTILARLPAPTRRVVFMDAGPLPGPPPSTMVSLCGPTRILREGAIPAARVQACLQHAGLQDGDKGAR